MTTMLTMWFGNCTCSCHVVYHNSMILTIIIQWSINVNHTQYIWWDNCWMCLKILNPFLRSPSECLTSPSPWYRKSASTWRLSRNKSKSPIQSIPFYKPLIWAAPVSKGWNPQITPLLVEFPKSTILFFPYSLLQNSLLSTFKKTTRYHRISWCDGTKAGV